MNPLCRTSLIIWVCLLSACASVPAPTSVQNPTPLPPATPAPSPEPTITQVYVPFDIPLCQVGRELDEPLKFDWPGIDQVGEADWYYYRCGQSAGDLATAYRTEMPQPPLNWREDAWVELPEGTLGVFFHSGHQAWIYLWFLSDKTSPTSSNLVLAERQGTPLDTSCH